MVKLKRESRREEYSMIWKVRWTTVLNDKDRRRQTRGNRRYVKRGYRNQEIIVDMKEINRKSDEWGHKLNKNGKYNEW